MMVGFDAASGRWRDELARNWNNAVPFSVPDLDVFEIDANAPVPTELGSVAGVGTILFNMIVNPNPANRNIYVTNTEANNRVRFEGAGAYVGVLGPKPSGDSATVRGNLHEARITVLDASNDDLGTPAAEFDVLPRHLNKHIPYGVSPVPAGVKEKSLATPLAMAISDDGSTLYVAGFGSNAVAVYDTGELENNTFVPDSANLITGLERPSGLALDDASNRLYVASGRILYVIDTTTRSLLQNVLLFTPESASISAGRNLLYNARLTSSNGEASCASCHLFGDMDDLAWDLGDPDGAPFANPNPSPPAVNFPPINDLKAFDPLKGPMTTQSLRGLSRAGPMHWRGDRTGGSNGGDPLDENAAFNAFNVAFPGLLGRDDGELDPDDMQALTTFALQLTYPPNPIRALDNSLTPQQQAGLNLYHGRLTDTVANCNGCHQLDRAQGFFGTGGGSTFESEAMEFKVAHLRNAYQKVGMFGQMPSDFFPSLSPTFMGDQVRSTGFLHDGSVATVFNFLSASVFSLDPGNPRPQSERRALEAFTIAFEADLAPVVGQQVTLSDTSGPDVDARITLLIQRAEANFVLPGGTVAKECDLIVKGVVGGVQRGWVYLGNGRFDPDKAADAEWSRGDLEAAAAVPSQPLTFTCVPAGSGIRMGINRDRDTQLDGDDAAPGKFNSITSSCAVGPLTPQGATSLLLLLYLLIWFRPRAHRRAGQALS
jgi:mono/diheme cytochrome c family protein